MGLNASSTLQDARGSYSVNNISSDLDKNELSYVTNMSFDRTKDESGRSVIDGSYKGLRRLFPSSLAHRNVEILKLNCNYLRAFPSDMKIMMNLKELYLNENNFEFLPLQICHIATLEILNLSCNQLQSLPEPIGNLTSLKKLDVSFNQLSSVPHTFQKLHMMEYLNLDGNRFLKIPSSIFHLTILKVLKMSGNMLTTLPKGLLLLSNLDELYVNENFIQEVLNVLKTFLLEMKVFEFIGNKCVRLVEDIEGKKDTVSH